MLGCDLVDYIWKESRNVGWAEVPEAPWKL